MKKLLLLLNAVCCITIAATFVNNDSVTILPEEEYVDLGLSVKWASKNLGAKSPSEFGNYYAWGEVIPKEFYKEDNCFFYQKTNSEIKEEGIYTNDGHLAKQADAAKKHLGSKWRLPSLNEIKELFDKCSIEILKNENNVLFRIKGPNGNVIIIPSAGGKKDEKHSLGGATFWSSDLPENDKENAFVGLIIDDGEALTLPANRYFGFSVRPVWDDNSASEDTSINSDY